MYDLPDLEAGYRRLLDVLRDIWHDSRDVFPIPEQQHTQRWIDTMALEGAGGGEQFTEDFVACVLRTIIAAGITVEGVRTDNGTVARVPYGLWNSKEGPWMIMTGRYRGTLFTEPPRHGPAAESPVWMNLRVSDPQAERLRQVMRRDVIRDVINARRHETFEAELPGLLPDPKAGRPTLQTYLRIIERFMELHDPQEWPVARAREYFRGKIGDAFSARMFIEARTELTGRNGRFADTWGKPGPRSGARNE